MGLQEEEDYSNTNPIGNGGTRLPKLTNCPNIPYQNPSSLIYPQIYLITTPVQYT